jgi:outer membrane protein TolC
VKLEELEQSALHNRASIVAARSRVAAAEARVDLAKVPYYPTVSGTVDVTAAPGGRLIRVNNVDDPEGPPYTVGGSRTITERGAFIPNFRYQGVLGVQSRLYDFGRTAASVRAARADRDAFAAGVSSERRSVILEVRTAYLAWLSAYGTRQIMAESAGDSSELRASMEAHVREGSRPGAELASAQYDEARAKLDLERSDGDLDGARIDLEQAAGAKLSKTAEPDLALLDRTLVTTGSPSHPEVAWVERKRDAASASAESHGNHYAPIVAVGATAGISGQTTTVFPLYQVGLSVTVPLLDGGAESAAAAAAAAQASDLSAQARELQHRAAASTERSRVALERSARRVELAQALVSAAEQSVRHAEDQHELGAGSFDDVVQARIRLSRAKLEVFNARLERARAGLELTSAER